MYWLFISMALAFGLAGLAVAYWLGYRRGLEVNLKAHAAKKQREARHLQREANHLTTVVEGTRAVVSKGKLQRERPGGRRGSN